MRHQHAEGVPVEKQVHVEGAADPAFGEQAGSYAAPASDSQNVAREGEWTNYPQASSELQMQPWVRDVGHFLSKITYGTLRIDLARPAWRVNYRTQRAGKGGSRNYRGDAVHPRASAMSRLHHEDLYGSRSFISGPVVPTSPVGRRFFDAGIGCNLDLAGAGFSPVARLRIMDAVRLHLAPYPVFKLKHSFRLWNSGLCLHTAYVQTLNSRTFQNLGKRGTWRIAIGRVGSNELVIAPDRIEVSNASVNLGPNINIFFSGELNYPRYLPDTNWQDQFFFIPSRMCVKTAW